jgi:hypothetical protein
VILPVSPEPTNKRTHKHTAKKITKGTDNMSSRHIFTKTADILHRGVVLGLLSAFGFQFYQIMSKTIEGKIDSPHLHSTYLKGKQRKKEKESVKVQRVLGL